MSESEEWRQIPGIPNFEASSWGRLRSMPREWMQSLGSGRGSCRRKISGRLLKCVLGRNGYLIFEMSPSRRKCLLSRAVCMAFHGLPPTPKHECAHIDGVPLNNRADNLKWATHLENERHKVGHGTIAKGEKVGTAKLQDAAIEEIFDRYLAGEDAADIAAEFGMSAHGLRIALRRKTFVHVPIPEEKVIAARELARANKARALQQYRERRAA